MGSREEEKRMAEALFEDVRSLKAEPAKLGGVEREELEWMKPKDVAKLGSWLYDRLTEEE